MTKDAFDVPELLREIYLQKLNGREDGRTARHKTSTKAQREPKIRPLELVMAGLVGDVLYEAFDRRLPYGFWELRILQFLRDDWRERLTPSEIVLIFLWIIDRRSDLDASMVTWPVLMAYRSVLLEEVPDEGWEWALWIYTLQEGSARRQSAEYWLRLWRDAQEAILPAKIEEAKQGLRALRYRDLDMVSL